MSSETLDVAGPSKPSGTSMSSETGKGMFDVCALLYL